MDTQELKREARREYMREWRKKNPEKVQAAQERYWTRKAAEIAAKREKPPISGDSNEGTTNAPKQERALAALISCPTARAAAKSAGLSESALRRYKQDPVFQAEYRKRCNELLEAACTKAKSALPPAIERLNAIVQDDAQQPREQIAAARAVCEYSLRLNEAVDIEQRLRALEERSQDH